MNRASQGRSELAGGAECYTGERHFVTSFNNENDVIVVGR
jgi:hypothetical protein